MQVKLITIHGKAGKLVLDLETPNERKEPKGSYTTLAHNAENRNTCPSLDFYMQRDILTRRLDGHGQENWTNVF